MEKIWFVAINCGDERNFFKFVAINLISLLTPCTSPQIVATNRVFKKKEIFCVSIKLFTTESE